MSNAGVGEEPAPASAPGFRPLCPLDELYAAEGRPLPAVRVLAPEELPDRARLLLAHERDMTPTLEEHHGDTIHLKLLARRLEGDVLTRLVLLVLEGSERPVEFGAITIYTGRFPETARKELLEGWIPLGSILTRHSIRHAGGPLGYLEVEADSLMAESLGLPGPVPLYGRRNVIRGADGRPLADILEILPP